MSSWPGALTGSIQIYTVKGNDQYLMILEVRSNEGRYLTPYTATSLKRFMDLAGHERVEPLRRQVQ
jgi:hypothetical protein